MEKISWVDKISNDEVLQKVNETKTTSDTVRKCKRVVRACAVRHEPSLHDITKGRMRVKATRGRKRMHLLHNLMKGKYVALKEQLKTGKSGRNC